MFRKFKKATATAKPVARKLYSVYQFDRWTNRLLSVQEIKWLENHGGVVRSYSVDCGNFEIGLADLGVNLH